MFTPRTTKNNSFRPSLERLENRETPAMVYGWNNGTYMFYDNGVAAADVPPVQSPIVQQIAAPVAKVVLNSVTQTAPNTVAFNVQIQGAPTGAGLQLNWTSDAALVSVTHVQQTNLIGVQQGAGGAAGNAGPNANAVVAAWVSLSPDQTWSPDPTSQMTLTFNVNPGATVNPISVAFTSLSPNWIANVDTSALDAFFAQQSL